MLSVRPEWVEKILNGEKTIEIRKTMPKCELPCKVYIYCTKGKYEQYTPPLSDTNYEYAFGYIMTGKVVAEFTLNKVEKFDVPYPAYFYKVQKQLQHIVQGSCLPLTPIHHYLKNKSGYAWHIDNLKIYNEPKELHEFGVYDERYSKARKCSMPGWFPLRRPPQSYCYIDLKDKEK